jgi:hypothetical protein
MSWLRWLPSFLLLAPWLVGPAVPSNDVRIRDAAGSVSFQLLDWETMRLSERVGRLWSGLFGGAAVQQEDGDLLRSYFRTGVSREQSRGGAEAALERVVANAYEQQGLTRSEPLRSDRLFPPVLVTLTSPPNVLVISPRTDLRVIGSVVLREIDTAMQERLEASADSTGVSSLVAPIGGLATYPSMVLEEDSPERVLSAVAHEWLHQYLIFYPLGAGYWTRQETREINETTADLVGQEIGAQLSDRYQLRRPNSTSQPPTAPRGGFDFRAFMRDTRLHVEELLAAGQVDQAEAFMRDRRAELQQNGYTVRKLNQAYFALYGSYGGGFAASPSNPIPDLLRQLRSSTGSLAEFVFLVRGVTTVDDLRAAVAQAQRRVG